MYIALKIILFAAVRSSTVCVSLIKSSCGKCGARIRRISNVYDWLIHVLPVFQLGGYLRV